MTAAKLSTGEAIVKVRLIDIEGVTCLDAKDYVRFNIAGNGELISKMGTSSGSDKSPANERKGTNQNKKLLRPDIY